MLKRYMAGRSSGLWPFGLLSATYFTHVGFFNPYLSLWLKELGLGVFTIGILTAVQSGTRLFAPLAWGWLSDHTGQRVRLLRISALVALLSSLGLYWQFNVWTLSLVLLLMFTHTSPMMSLSEASMAARISENGQFDARRYGRIRLWGSLGFLVTVFAAGAWFDRHGMVDFVHWTVATLLAVNLSVWVLPRGKEARTAAGGATRIGPVLKRPEVHWFFISVFFHVLSHVCIYVFFSLYLDELGYSKTLIGMLWALSVAVEVVWFFTQGRWLKRLTTARWLQVLALLTLLRMGVTTTGADVLWWLLLAQALHAFTFAAHHSVCMALLSEYFPGDLRARGQALYAVVGYGLTGVLGALGGGAISEHWGLQAVYACATVSALLAFCGAWCFCQSRAAPCRG